MIERKKILVADADPRAGEDFSRALGEQWEIVWASSGTSALALLEEHPCQVVVANLELAELDGAELLNRIRRKSPRMIRFLAARDEDKERVVKDARGAHQFLSKPYDTAALKEVIERALALDVWISSDRIRETIARIRTLPSIPTLYVEVLAALRSENATTEQVGAIIAKDMAMTTRMLQLLNSACFGLTREITDPAEAVGILGFETVKTMVMTIKLLNQYDKLKASDFNVERLWLHSTAVARTARQIALLETGNRALADAAFTAGLLHDVGKVILASNFEERYFGALLLGYKQHLTAWDVEKEIFGANHGEIGAYLLGLWGLPLNLVEAAALHHEPSRSASQEFTVLTAVHVANVFEREISRDDLGMICPLLDVPYLEGLGLVKRVKTWRVAISGPDALKNQPKAAEPTVARPAPVPPAPRPARVVAPAPAVGPAPKPVPQPAPFPVQASAPVPAPAPVSSSAAPAGRSIELAGTFSRNKWLFFGAGAAIALLLVWFAVKKPADQTDMSQPGRAAITTPEPIAPASAVATAAHPKSDQASAPVKATDSAAPKSATPDKNGILDSSPLVVRARTATNEPVATPPPTTDFSDFKLQGIFYSAGDPTAILNGKSVRPHDHVGDTLVVSITASNITLESQGQRKTLSIK